MSDTPDHADELDHPAVAQVATALAEAGLKHSAEGIRYLPHAVRTAAEAAAAVGVTVGAIANSLVFRATSDDGTQFPLLVLTSGAHRADTRTLAALIGARRVSKASPEFVREHTGQVIGGVAPVGHPTRITTLVDDALREYDTVWAAAGHPHTVFPTTFTGLVSLTTGRAATVTGTDATPREAEAASTRKAVPR